MSAEEPSSRARFLAASATVATSAVVLPLGAIADEQATTATVSQPEKVPLVTTKLGGQLEPFADVSKGYRLAKPIGWNRFDGEAGEYVVKMVDLVDRSKTILLYNSPVKSDTTLTMVGDLQSLGEKLSKNRDAEIVKARDRITEGMRIYDYEFKYKDRHELQTLVVNKSKLWRLTITCPEKSWNQQGQVFKTIVDSFLPRL
ncbi:unnamed protein product [Ascophyllum nodosum]